MRHSDIGTKISPVLSSTWRLFFWKRNPIPCPKVQTGHPMPIVTGMQKPLRHQKITTLGPQDKRPDGMHPFLPFFSRIVLFFSFRCKNMIDLSIISVKEMSRIKEVEKTVQMVMDWEWICSNLSYNSKSQKCRQKENMSERSVIPSLPQSRGSCDSIRPVSATQTHSESVVTSVRTITHIEKFPSV